MSTRGHTNDSGEHYQSEVNNVSRTRAREIGRSLAHIGDRLNQEMQAQRTVQSSTTSLILQLAILGGVSMSFLIPVRVSIQYEEGISLLVYVISFYTGSSFIPVRNG